MSRIKLALKLYSSAVLATFLCIFLYAFYTELSCLKCTFSIWEPNPVVHIIELAMYIAAIPGMFLIVWEADT